MVPCYFNVSKCYHQGLLLRGNNKPKGGFGMPPLKNKCRQVPVYPKMW